MIGRTTLKSFPAPNAKEPSSVGNAMQCNESQIVEEAKVVVAYAGSMPYRICGKKLDPATPSPRLCGLPQV